MKEEKGKNIIIGALLCIIILLIAAIILLLTNKSTFKKSNTNEDNTQTVETTYTYKEIKGLYSYKGNLQKDDYGNDYREDYRLYLYENGTFIYNNYTLGPHGHIGNYIIVDNTIKLNYLYGTVGGTGMFPETGTEEINIGDKYTCEVKSDMATPYTFYVLTDPADGQVNLIMDRNICNDGSITYTSTNNYCRYKWYSAAQNNTYGPTTVMAELYAGTKDWDNVPDMIMNYTDENNGTATNKGYTSIITNNGVTTITGKPTTNTSTVGTASKPLKARLPKQSEVMGAGCTTSNGSCPTWLMENMTYWNGANDKYSMNNNSEAYQKQLYGYWLLSSDSVNSAYARFVYFNGRVYNYYTTYGSYGARPVITVSTSDLSN